MSANLDGSEVIPLITTNVRCPSSLRLDIPRHSLYWVDPELGVISSLMLDLGLRRVRFHQYLTVLYTELIGKIHRSPIQVLAGCDQIADQCVRPGV